jgi:hypothetical protein
VGVSFIGGGKRTEKNTDLPQITGKLYNIMLYRLGEIRTHNIIGDTARTARFSKKSLGSDVGEIKKMSEKLKKKVGVDTAKCPRKMEHGDLL